MTPEQLKASILQYAIQGKLVAQRPEEGTGEELYQQIQAEKQRLIQEKKIKKEKPLAEISEDEVPFDIPESWKWVRVGEIFAHNTGKAMNSSAKKVDKPGRIKRFITTSNLYWNSFDFSSVKEMFFSDDELERCTVTKGDLLMCEGGAYYGRTAIWNYDYDICFQNHVHRLRPYKAIELRFFYNLFYFYKSMNMMNAKGTAMPGLSSQTLHQMVVPLPSLAEQKRIVAKIEEFLPLVDRYAAAYEKLEQFNAKFPEDMKKSILQYAIQGKLVEQRAEEGTAEELYQQIQAEKQHLIAEKKIKKEKTLPEIAEDEVPFDIPESWKWVRLGSVVSVYGGKRIPAGRKLTIEDTGHVYIRVSDMKDGYISTENLQFVPKDIYPSISRYIIGKEDVFITVAGTIGRVGKIPPELDGANLTENADRLVFSQLDQNWLIKCLQSSVVQSQIIDATTKVGQPKLAIVRIQNMMIPLPPLSEQKRIVAKIEELLPLCERLK